MPRARDRYSMGTPHQGGIKVPLNDDRREKERRLKSRRSLHENQMEQIRAAATPVKRRQSGLGARTPANEDDVYVGGDAVTPMKRVPILANFEEWMKMATDNKINAANSWNFALIDYFHDMSLLKEGDGVNFQRASCTLDGCVKIYTSRVDSVATETGKLLSGLADSRDKKNKGGDDAEGDGEAGSDDDEEGEDGTKKPKRKRAQRSAEATLVSSFQQLALKKMELEFSVDPLFKKASADFDEGGAKGLLLNHLSIDQNGRIVFDSSDDAQDACAEEKRRDSMEADDGEDEEDAEEPAQEAEIDMASLGARFFPDLSRLDAQDICPSLKNFDMSDPNASKDLPFLKAPDDWRDQNKETGAPGDNSGMFLDDDNAGGFDDDDDMGAFDLPANTGFGEGGEVWAKEAALETQMRVHTMNPDGDDGDNEDGMNEVGGFDNNTSRFGVALTSGREEDQENILNYFDQALSKNWAGPEHWRIRRIKDNKAAAATGPTKRKEKEPFQIDFAAPMTQSIADALYTGASSSSTISMPKNQWKSKTRNLLPDDKHFNSRQLLRLFLKPKARMGSRRNGGSGRSGAIGSGNDTQRDDRDVPDGEMDEVFWAQQRNAAGDNDDNNGATGTYDADFFQDDALGAVGGADEDEDDIFADAREMFSPAPEGAPPNLGETLGGEAEGAFGAQLVTQSRRFRPEYVQYARVAKKVDVRRLKEEMWRGIGLGDSNDADADESSLNNSTLPPSPSRRSSTMPPPPIPTGSVNGGAPPLPKAADGSLMFTDVVNNLQSVYPKKTLADISTSYCFICLLHLANEKGLVIENQEGFTDLSIRRDPRGVGEGGE